MGGISRRLAQGVILIAILSGRSMAQDSVSIEDFRFPETKAVDLKGSLSGGLSSGNSGSSSLYGAGAPRTQSSNSGFGSFTAGSTFLFFHTKDNHDQSFVLSTSGSYFYSDGEDMTADTTTRQREDRDSRWDGTVSANWSYLHYVTDEGFHFLGGIAADYQGSHARLNSSRDPDPAHIGYEQVSGSYSVHFHGWLGAGFGRVRDGAFIFRAMRVVERLREDGVITRPLSRSEMLSLADRLAAQREYTTNFERYQKYFVKDIVDDLDSLGIVSQRTVTPYSALRILEGFQENVQSRFFGWRVYFAFHDSHDQSGLNYRTVYSGGASLEHESIDNSWAYVSEFGLQYGRPLSLYTHFYAEALLDLPNHDPGTRNSVRVSATVSHQLGERLLLVGSYQYNGGVSDAFSYDVDRYSRSFTHTFRGNFVYFLEDQLRFQTAVRYTTSHANYYGYSLDYIPISSSGSGFSFSFGLVYNII